MNVNGDVLSQIHRCAPGANALRLSLRIVLSALLAGVLTGCVQTVKQERHPGLAERDAPIARIAVLPFRLGRTLAAREEAGGTSPSVAAALLAHHLTESLAARVDVVTPGDVQRALDAAHVDARELGAVARLVADEFGADALLVGELARWREREGGAAGASRGATLGFSVSVHGAPRGERLWSANVDETQHSLSDNVFAASRYPGGGTRWLTAEELAHWAADQTAASLPLTP